MKATFDTVKLIFLMFAMLLLIFFNEIAKEACVNGMELCMKTVIPSLFPFFCISGAVVPLFTKKQNRITKLICRVCGMPMGSEGILISGLLGGYPVGAKTVSDSFRNGTIGQKDAERMLAFCSNCGPAFVFGMVSCLYQRMEPVFALWLIHMASAVTVGSILPGKSNTTLLPTNTKSSNNTIYSAIKGMASVCAWVILFRIMVSFLVEMIPIPAYVYGILEITNGILALNSITSPSLRFLLASVFINFGGICVAMQTASVISKLPVVPYLTGKGIQTSVSTLLSFLFCVIFWREIGVYEIIILIISLLPGVIAFVSIRKKYVVFQEHMMYNRSNTLEMGMKKDAVS